MERVGVVDYADLHRWSVEHRPEFWEVVMERLDIQFARPPAATFTGTPQHPEWLPGAELNIAESALDGPADAVAVIHGVSGGLEQVTFAELRNDVARCANGMSVHGIGIGDTVAIVMPMTYEAVVAYLAIVSLGAAVVSIADSFAPEEIALRVELAEAEWAVSQLASQRAGKTLPMYEKVVAAGVKRVIVVPGVAGPELRPEDVHWDDLLSDDIELRFVSMPTEAVTNILFSSGTTGEPKSIPWTHASPIKAAMDGHFHQDIKPGDVVAWPTNLGWMMGPWLIYAALINDAAVALCEEVPTGEGFIDFVEEAKVTMLGVVPSLVAAWRQGDLLAGHDLSSIRCFSSTGEASRPDDMEYLMAAAGGRPVIEYCGGTEIGGGYIAATMHDAAIASTFTTPTLGLDFVLVDDDGSEAEEGEVLIVPPSIGLSTRLLNRDHDAVYYDAGLPDIGRPVRRHGDHMARVAPGRWRAMGRVDDTMNLGGIKISSAELERVAGAVDGVAEVAAIAVPPTGGGPDRLVIYAVLDADADWDAAALRDAMAHEIRVHLNPLFKVHEVVVVESLPRTASAKVMRRSLRSAYSG